MSNESLRTVLADPGAIAALFEAHRAYQGEDLIRGDEVRVLQKALNAQGFDLKEDGILGSGTGAAIGAFQHISGLEVDGMVGPKTADALGIAPFSLRTGQSIGGGFFHPTGGVGSLGRKGRNDFGAPRAGGKRKHKGQDIMLAEGKRLFAVTAGVVRWDENSSAGTIVYLEGDDGNRYSYFHLSKRAGSDRMRVEANQVIGFVGNTGGSSGAHLHFEVRPGGGAQVDPLPFLKGSITG
jgi:murein DD-endopeptidase MepM/ murein hydrolase activator NlpD